MELFALTAERLTSATLGDAGQINLGGPGASDAVDAHGDVSQSRGPGQATACSTIGNGAVVGGHDLETLFTGKSTGTVNFVADVTLGGASTRLLPGNTVNIFNGVVVTVGGSNRTQRSVSLAQTGSNANYYRLWRDLARAPVFLAEVGCKQSAASLVIGAVVRTGPGVVNQFGSA